MAEVRDGGLGGRLLLQAGVSRLELAVLDFQDVEDPRQELRRSASQEDRMTGGWPGLDERPQIARTARD